MRANKRLAVSKSKFQHSAVFISQSNYRNYDRNVKMKMLVLDFSNKFDENRPSEKFTDSSSRDLRINVKLMRVYDQQIEKPSECINI